MINTRNKYCYSTKNKLLKNYNFNSLDWTEQYNGDTVTIHTNINRTFYKCPCCSSTNIVKNGYKISKVYHNTNTLWKYVFFIKVSKYKYNNCLKFFQKKNNFALNFCNYSIETFLAAFKNMLDIPSTFSTVARNLNISPLLQDYREFNCLQSREEAEKEIDEIIEKIDQSKLNSFKDFSNMLKTWKEYILNSFIRITDDNGKSRRLSDEPERRY